MRVARLQLFRRLFGGERKEAATPQLPPGDRIYAIGDVHGRADLLAKMRELIQADLLRHPVERSLTVLLGDYVDRGNQSKLVLDQLTTAGGAFCNLSVCLRGNHEAMLLAFLTDPQTGAGWLANGGFETVRSYIADARSFARSPERAADALREEMPPAHLDFLRSLPVSYTWGDYFFCHAGVRPGILLDQQSSDDLLWIREPFLTDTSDFGKCVVHGHTPVREPEIRPNRINIDTGAYISGRLTCLVLEGAERRFIYAQTSW